MGYLQSFGAIGLFLHALIDAVIFPIPAFFLQVSLSALHPENAIGLAAIGYAGCLIGTPIGYALGRTSGHLILNRFMKKKWLDSATALFQRHGETAILIGAFTPIPFKIFTILSGCMRYPLWKLLAYAAIGRGAKFFIVGILFYMYGRAAEHMIDGMFGVILVAVGALFCTVWLLIRRFRKQKKPERAAVPVKES